MMKEEATWRFPRAFWSANTAELFERMAFYAMYIGITLYLTNAVGFSDIQTGYISGFFAAFLYLLPTFSGALSDKLGFRKSLALAFGLLTIGYGIMGSWPAKFSAILALILIATGGSFVKPIISGTVAKSSSEINRARAFSIFYVIVNIGSFTGKTIAYPLRISLGVEDVCLFSSAMALIGFLITSFFYREVNMAGEGKSFKEVGLGLLRVLRNGRFISIILIIAGFWILQSQLYSTIPKYAIRMLGRETPVEWMANINPAIIVLCQLWVTQWTRKWRDVNSIMVGLALIPFSALIMSISPTIFMLSLGIAFTACGEMFLSPRFLEYASRQAPEGEVGLYMGYAHLHTFFATLAAFIISGYLLDAFCPDPRTVSPELLPHAYDRAHYIWYVFTAIGVVAFLSLIIFKLTTDWIDKKKKI